MPKDLSVLQLKNTLLIPGIGTTSKYLDGPQKLIQRIIKCLFTVQGSILLDPEFGVGLQYQLPSVYDDRQIGSTKAKVTSLLLICEKQIKEDDASGNDDANGKLASLQLKDITYGTSGTEWIIEINMRTMAGTSTNFSASI